MELSPQQDVYYIDTVSSTDYFIDTVTPSAIQLNKEKIMSIELDGPLYLGSNSMQQQVDQNTTDIADLKQDVSDIESDIGSLDNLATSDKSSLVNAINETLSVLDPTQTADYIKNSKGLKSGEISTNASILPWIEEMSHSTFDLSKFTVVGSPNITDDGIASGFSGSNYLTKELQISGNVELQCEVNTGIFSAQEMIFNIYDITNSKSMYDVRRTSQTKLGFYGLINNEYSKIAELNVADSTKYNIKVTINNSTASLYVNNTLVNSSTNANNINTNCKLYIGVYNISAFPWGGSIDLKQFSITVDGVPVFSGNKTGIDTIKSDNWTPQGTPDISDDGILSCTTTNNTNYITYDGSVLFPNSSNIYESFKLRFRGNPNISSFSNSFNFMNGGFWGIVISNCQLDLMCSINGNHGLGGGVPSSYWGKWIDILWERTATEVRASYKLATSSEYILSGSYSTTDYNLYQYFVLGYRTVDTTNSAFEIDLNETKFYHNGELVYQPCLKIPYTESKTGSKIVDSIYRDRVNDMAEQFGYAPYYTLQDEPKGNYQVVGSPTISSDFVASGFSSGQAIQAYSLNTSKPFLIKGLINYSASGGNQTILGVNSYGIAIIGVNGTSKLYLSLGTSTSSFDIGNITTNTTLQTNTDYYYKFAWDGYQYTFDISTDNENFTNCATITSSSSIGNGTWDIVLGANQPTLGTNWLGSIDLNAFKIYTDGQLAYEAVTDPNFTLPMGELYGLIGQRTLRDSYRNGINYWELYSNRDLEQGGSCTSGVEVTFARPFADTNYVLSVPYSAKSATAFTPTQTGDWIAKGKGIL